MSSQLELFASGSSLPSGLLYRPDFIDEREEGELLEGIRLLELREAQYKEFTAKRRVASFGAGYDYDENELTPAPVIASFLLPLRSKVARWAGVSAEDFGYALVSEYRPGTQLGWHRDVPHFEVVAGVSLGSACTMRFRRYPPGRKERIFSLEVQPRSAYILKEEARWGWQHSVAPTPALRYSITFRTRRG
jgi:alkylated DNA repair dioxygenase AlkB